MDYLGPFTKSRSGNRYVPVMTDYHTKWVEAVACPAASAAEAAKGFVEQVLLRHGTPETIISDRGQHCVGKLAEETFRLMGMNHVTTTAYHPQANGLCERFNCTLADILSMYVSLHHRDWDEFLFYTLLAYNSSQHETTGFTPFFLLNEHEPVLLINVTLRAQDGDRNTLVTYKIAFHLRQAYWLVSKRERNQQQRNKERYNATRRSADFHPGDLVYV